MGMARAMGTDRPRIIDAGRPPDRFARGWHCLGLAAAFRDGEPGSAASRPHAVQAFGTKLVVFADAAGELHVLDAYCRHMGGDLTMGTIKGDEVACPFHDWRWSGDGRCAQIPYARRVPPAARNPVLAHPGTERAAVRLARPGGEPAGRRRDHPAHRGRLLNGVDGLDLGFDPGGGRELPRGDRQRGGHAALLLHPLRVPDVLQERLRGAHRVAVPAHPGAARRRPGAAAGGRRAARKPPSVPRPPITAPRT